MLTSNVEVDFEGVLSATILGHTEILSSILPAHSVDNQRVDSLFIDDDLVHAVIKHLVSITEPEYIWSRASGDDAVKAHHLAFGGILICWGLTEHGAVVFLRHTTGFALRSGYVRAGSWKEITVSTVTKIGSEAVRSDAE